MRKFIFYFLSCTREAVQGGGGDKVNTFTSTSDASSVTLSPEFSALLRCISVPFVQHVIQLGKQSRAGRRCGRINAVATTMTSVVIELKKPVDSRPASHRAAGPGLTNPRNRDVTAVDFRPQRAARALIGRAPLSRHVFSRVIFAIFYPFIRQ